MKRHPKWPTIIPHFVELMPSQLQEGVLYISEKYSTAIHKCCCGCGLKVVTPLSPAKWKLLREADFVTLHPSIGNWNFPCQSHYWIRQNHVEWAGAMTNQQISLVQNRDRRDSQRHIEQVNARKAIDILNQSTASQSTEKSREKSEIHELWHLLKSWWDRLNHD